MGGDLQHPLARQTPCQFPVPIIDIGHDERPLLDINFRKHVDQDIDETGRQADLPRFGPVLTSGPRTVQVRFENRWNTGSAKAMRDHLATLLPSKFIQDEHGEVVSIEDVPSQHLAKLQAKSWRECPQLAARAAAFQRTTFSEQEVHIANCVAAIANELEESNSAFVLCDRYEPDCSFAFCGRVHILNNASRSSQEIRLEPLVDWLTLDPVAEQPDEFGRQIIVYQRNTLAKSEFQLNLRKRGFIKPNPVRFCFQCLRYLLDARNEAWHIMLQDRNAMSDALLVEPRHCFDRDRETLVATESSSTEDEDDSPTLLLFDGPNDDKRPSRSESQASQGPSDSTAPPPRNSPAGLPIEDVPEGPQWTPINVFRRSMAPSLSPEPNILTPLRSMAPSPEPVYQASGTGNSAAAPAQPHQHQPGIAVNATPAQGNGPTGSDRPGSETKSQPDSKSGTPGPSTERR